MNATPAWIASASATLTMPDFSAVAGWSDTWAPGTAVTTPWTITATGGDIDQPRCREGARALTVTASGSN